MTKNGGVKLTPPFSVNLAGTAHHIADANPDSAGMGSQANAAGSEVLLGAGIVLFIGKILHVEDHLDVFGIIASPQVDHAIVRTQVGKLARTYGPYESLVGRRPASLLVGQPFDIGILTIAPNILESNPGVIVSQRPAVFAGETRG